MFKRICVVFMILIVGITLVEQIAWACDQDQDSCSGSCDDSPLNAYVSTGNSGNQCPGGTSSHPVRYLDGVPIIHIGGLHVPSVGGGWSFYLRYLNRVTPDGSGIILDDAGYNWLTSNPKIIVRSGTNPDLWLQKGSGRVLRYSYDSGASEWQNKTGSYSTIKSVTFESINCYLLEGKRGGKAYFYKTGNLTGQPYKLISISGEEVIFSYYSSGYGLCSYKLKSIYLSTFL